MRSHVRHLPNFFCAWAGAFSDTPLIDHLVMREFVSGPPIYRSIQQRARDRKPSLKESSWTFSSCGFRTEFFEKRPFFGSNFSCNSECLKNTHRFVGIKPHMHMLRVYGHRRWRRSPRQVSAAHASCIQLQTLTGIPKTGLSVTNSLVYGAVDRRSAHELSHY